MIYHVFENVFIIYTNINNQIVTSTELDVNSILTDN